MTLTVASGVDQDRRTLQVTVAFAAPTVRCGEVITANVTLRADLHCAGRGLQVGADDITIDLNGHTLSGSTTSSNAFVNDLDAVAGIRNALYPNLTIRDGTIAGFSNSVGIGQAGGDGTPDTPRTRMENVVLERLDVRNSSRLEIRGGRVERRAVISRSAQAAFVDVVFNADVSGELNNGVSVTGSSIRRNFGLVKSNDQHLRNNSISGPLTVSQSNGLVLVNNTIDGGGLYIANSSDHSTVRGNTFRDNEIAIELRIDGAEGTVIEDNTFEDNRLGLTSPAGASPARR